MLLGYLHCTDFEGLQSEDGSTASTAEPTIDQYKVALSHALEELQIMKYVIKTYIHNA